MPERMNNRMPYRPAAAPQRVKAAGFAVTVETARGVPEREVSFDQFPIAMTYTPWQRWCEPYCAQKGLERGTIFPPLDLPFSGRRC